MTKRPKSSKPGKYIITESEYENGKTELSEEQSEMVERLSKLLTGYPENFNTLPRNYSPSGFIGVLNDQVKLKVDQRELDAPEQLMAFRLLEDLRKSLGVE
ncbi:hypothetical protein [Paenibacillus rubinfantis]|uniref:hypothetical protein n=1 Tax=Paenibacillus rubinfantis TaxID=1720296 RepID=UPI00073E3E00|nr:hypothetical protein [Paenibacillus rubinfantis]